MNIMNRMLSWFAPSRAVQRAAEFVGLGYWFTFDVEMYASVAAWQAGEPYNVYRGEKNILTPRGRLIWFKQFTGQASAVDFYSTANAFIFVGDSATANPGTPGQPFDLLGTNKVGVQVDATAPTISLGADQQTVTCNFTATFDVNTANFSWREAGLCNASATAGATDLTSLPGSGTLFNRYVSPLGLIGTKTSGLVWVASMNLILGPTGD